MTNKIKIQWFCSDGRYYDTEKKAQERQTLLNHKENFTNLTGAFEMVSVDIIFLYAKEIVAILQAYLKETKNVSDTGSESKERDQGIP